MLGRFHKWRRGLFHGWWMVLASGGLNAISSGFYGTGFQVYFLPLQRDLGFNRTIMSVIFGTERLEGGVWGLIAGVLIDRWGPKLLMLLGTLMAAGGFVLLAYTHNFLSFFLVYLGLLSIGMHVGFNQGATACLNNWFNRKRGMAFSLAATGISVGAAAITPIVAIMVLHLGWRQAAVISGIAVLILSLPLVLLMRSTPEEMGMAPDGDKPRRAAAQPGGKVAYQQRDVGGFTVRQAFATSSFWLLSLAIALRIGVRTGVTVHLVPLMVWKGTPEATAGLMLGLMAVSSGIGRLVAGWLGDRWSYQKVSTVGMFMGTVALVVLMLSGGSPWQMAVFLLLFGGVDSVASLSWAMIGDFYGRRSFATLRGIVSFALSVASMAFPVFTGLVWDTTHSYFGALVPLAALYVLTGALFWVLKPPRQPAPLAPAIASEASETQRGARP